MFERRIVGALEVVGDVVEHRVEVGRRLEAGGHLLDLALDLLGVGFDGDVEEVVQSGQGGGDGRGGEPALLFRAHPHDDEQDRERGQEDVDGGVAMGFKEPVEHCDSP